MVKPLTLNKVVKNFDRNLLKYYGINKYQMNKICSLFGLGSSGFISLLDKSFIVKIEMYIREFHLLDDYLKLVIISNIDNLQLLKLYKGIRHK